MRSNKERGIDPVDSLAVVDLARPYLLIVEGREGYNFLVITGRQLFRKFSLSWSLLESQARSAVGQYSLVEKLSLIHI